MKTTEINGFAERERALENEFFYRIDKELLRNLRRELEEEEARLALAVAGHLSGETLLEELVDLGVKPESLAAVNLIPLVLIAWADHQVKPKERLTVLRAAVDEGIPEQTPAYNLLEQWLDTEPDDHLADAWTRFIQELCGTLTVESRDQLCDEVMTRARAVAKSAHGFLGIGRISPEEQQVLDQLQAAFEL